MPLAYRTGGSVNRQPRRGRRMIRKSSHPNFRSMPLWKLLVDGQAIIHLEARCEARNLTSSVLWVELRLLDSRFALKSCSYLFWGHSSLFLFLVSTRQSLWSIAWTSSCRARAGQWKRRISKLTRIESQIWLRAYGCDQIRAASSPFYPNAKIEQGASPLSLKPSNLQYK